MENFLFNSNLPHIYNSCGINALFISLSYLKVDSTDDLIDKMLDYCKTQHKINENVNIEYGVFLMKEFYKKYNIDYGFQNCRLLLNKIYDTLIFDDSQIEIGDDYEKINLHSKTILLDYEQTKSMTDYNITSENIKNKLITYKKEKFNSMSILLFNNQYYIPCLYIVCLHNHYITLVNTKNGLIIYNDLDQIKLVEQKFVKELILNLKNNIEFIGYTKVNI